MLTLVDQILAACSPSGCMVLYDLKWQQVATGPKDWVAAPSLDYLQRGRAVLRSVLVEGGIDLVTDEDREHLVGEDLTESQP